jgi:hypothetical protein
MDTKTFTPTEKYLRRCVDDVAVRHFLEESHYRKPVYVITSIKTVSGAQRAPNTSQSFHITAGAGAQFEGMFPEGARPEVRRGKTTKRKSAVSWEGSSNFVFAYKVSEIRVRRSGEVKRERGYSKGAFYEFEIDDEADTLEVSVVEGPSGEWQDDSRTEIVEEDDDLVSYGVPERIDVSD